MPAIATRERKLGSVTRALKHISAEAEPVDLSSLLRELQEAPDKKSVTSMIEEDVFQGIAPCFPVLLAKATAHRMARPDFLLELEVVLSMGDARDPRAPVFVYSLQVAEPKNFSELIDRKLLSEAVPRDSLLEVVNGYVRHELLYELPVSYRNIVLVHLAQLAQNIRLSLKPPWSQHKVDSVVELT